MNVEIEDAQAGFVEERTLSQRPEVDRGGVAELVRIHRRRAGISAAQLAALVGVEADDIFRLECGQRSRAITLNRLYSISNYLNISPSLLIEAIHS